MLLELALSAEVLVSLMEDRTTATGKKVPTTKRQPTGNKKIQTTATATLGPSFQFHCFHATQQTPTPCPTPCCEGQAMNDSNDNNNFLPPICASFAPLPVKNEPSSPITSCNASTNLPGVSTLLKGSSVGAPVNSTTSSFQLTQKSVSPQQPLLFHHHIIHPPQQTPTTQRFSNHNGPQAPKRRRRKTTAAECAVLRAAFDAGMFHPPLQLRKEWAAAVNMTERQIQVWFQNRRQKFQKGLLPVTVPQSPPSSSSQRPIIL